MSDNNKPDIYLLWTGGWDSTFRLVQIQKEYTDEPVVVQPVYISGAGRKSEAIEIEHMNKMLPMIRALGKNEIRDLLLVEKDSLPEIPGILDAYKRFLKYLWLGVQYEWIARLATLYPGIEIGIEKPNGEYGGCTEVVNRYGKTVYRDGCYYLDKDKSTEDCKMFFENLAFPIWDITETEMVKLIHEWHCENIMKNIWFCQNPIDGKPCGYCRPCQQKMECEMDWLVPESGQNRYRFFRKAKRIVGTKNSYTVTRILCK